MLCVGLDPNSENFRFQISRPSVRNPWNPYCSASQAGAREFGPLLLVPARSGSITIDCRSGDPRPPGRPRRPGGLRTMSRHRTTALVPTVAGVAWLGLAPVSPAQALLLGSGPPGGCGGRAVPRRVDDPEGTDGQPDRRDVPDRDLDATRASGALGASRHQGGARRGGPDRDRHGYPIQDDLVIDTAEVLPSGRPGRVPGLGSVPCLGHPAARRGHRPVRLPAPPVRPARRPLLRLRTAAGLVSSVVSRGGRPCRRDRPDQLGTGPRPSGQGKWARCRVRRFGSRWARIPGTASSR